MRSRLDRQLDEMKQNLIEMGSCCENCIGQVALTRRISQRQIVQSSARRAAR